MPTYRLPTAIKLAYTLWMVVWVPAYWVHNGPANFLWLCDIANFVVAAAVWMESPLLFSSQAVAVLVIQVAWIVDFTVRLTAGFHPFGGTEYMFDEARPLWLRGLSFFHLFMPMLLLWAIWRLGYDRRGWLLQSALAGIVLPLSFFAAGPQENLNWLWAPFGVPQRWLEPPHYLIACMLLYPALLFWPTHRLLLAWVRRGARRVLPDDEAA